VSKRYGDLHVETLSSDITFCNPVKISRHLKSSTCIHFQSETLEIHLKHRLIFDRLYGAIPERTDVSIAVAVRTSNPTIPQDDEVLCRCKSQFVVLVTKCMVQIV
jgi:hypothetical protein